MPGAAVVIGVIGTPTFAWETVPSALDYASSMVTTWSLLVPASAVVCCWVAAVVDRAISARAAPGPAPR